jgi:hypothetical protein
VAASLAYFAIIVLIHEPLPETTSFAVLRSKIAGSTQLYRPAGSLRIGCARQGFSFLAHRAGIWLSRSPKELPQPAGFAMHITDSEFVWTISVATFFAVVLIFILGFHIISVLKLTWRPNGEQERSTDGTGDADSRTTDRRRSKRLEVVRPVFVSGHRIDAKPFFEEAISLQVSAHGGLLVLATSVRVGQELLLATDRMQVPLQSCRVARLVSSTPLRSEVAVEFARPTPEFWQVAS